MSMQSRRAAWSASLVAAALVLSGCVFQSDPAPTATPTVDPGPEQTITGPFEIVSFWPQGSPRWDDIQALADELAAEHEGLAPSLVFGGGQDAPPIEARWRAGNPPEVNPGFFDSADPEGGEWVKAGAVVNLTEAMNQPLAGYPGSWKDAILPGVLDLLTVSDGQIYASPAGVTTLQFFYNQKIFDDLGISVPKTFDELVSAADTIRASGTAPFTVTGTFLPYMQMYWDYLALRYIGFDELTSAINGEVALESLPGAVEAAAALERLTVEGNFTSGFRSTDFTAAQMHFFQGNAAMILMGSWLQGEMSDAIPADFQLGTFPFPSVSGGHGSADGLFGGINVWTVAAKAGNPDAGVEFLRLVASKENQEREVAATNGISAFRGVTAPDGFENVTAALELGSAFYSSYMGVLSRSQEVQAAYNQPIARLFFGEIDGATMLKQMSDGLLAAGG